MAEKQLIVHVTIDDMREVFDAINEQIAELRDRLDAHAGRLQRLERLPGVQEALKTDEGSSEANSAAQVSDR